MQMMNAMRALALAATLVPLGACAGEVESDADTEPSEQALLRRTPRAL